MVSRSIEIAVVIGTLIAVQTLVAAKLAVASDQAEPAVTSDRKSELIVVAEASGASDPDDAASPQPSRVVSEPTTLAPQPPVLYQPPRRGAPARDRVGAGITRGATAQPTPLALAPGHV